MFKHQTTELLGLEVCEISQENGVGLKVFPALGGRLYELTLRVGEKLISVLMPHTHENDIIPNPYALNSPLIPFPNRLRDGRYTFAGQEYEFPITSTSDNTALHGLTREQPFKVVAIVCEEDLASCTLSHAYTGASAAFPWPFQVKITYSIQGENVFSCRTRITNTGGQTIPMGSGWHHYLSFPDGLDHIELKLPESRQILVDDRQLPTGEKQVLDTYEKFTLFNGCRFDTGFELSRPGEANTVELRDPARGIALQVIMKGGEWGYKYYQLFNHPDGAGFAVEPMTCNIDALNNEEGLITLAPGEQVQHEFQIRLAAH